MTRAALSLGLLTALAACGHAPPLVAPASIATTQSAAEGPTPPMEAARAQPPPATSRPSTDAATTATGAATTPTAAATTATSRPSTDPAPAANATAQEPDPAVNRDPDSGLPTPPSEEPRAYAAWLASLPRADQRQIAAFCKKNPVEYEATCGGIGPLHIPVPPSRIAMRPPGAPTWEQWRDALTPRQHAYFNLHCKSEDEAFSRLCGATPLVLSFDGAPVVMAPAQDGARFAFVPGDPVRTDWPTAATPWLALDRNGDGAITNGAELFGSSTPLADGRPARNGFDALRALDANGDGKIDRDDPAFSRLVAWTDRNGDRRSTPEELTPVSTIVESISLSERIEPRCDARLNCERERAAMTSRGADGRTHEGAVVDLYVQFR